MALSFSRNTNTLPVSSVSQTAQVSLTAQGAMSQPTPTESNWSTQLAHTANTEEMARLGGEAVFRQRTMRVTQQILHQVERRDRMVLMLQDGQRTLRDVARLLHRSDVEIAQVVVWLLKQGYVEYVGTRR